MWKWGLGESSELQMSHSKSVVEPINASKLVEELVNSGMFPYGQNEV